jgi:UDP-glucose 4-epimerase
MRAIVFGGSGFLGSHVADTLSEAGYQVKIFDLVESPHQRLDQEMIVGDIMEFDKVVESLDGCSYVYNFAGIANLDDASTRPIETAKLNVEGNINILEACRLKGVSRFVYASTIYVYSNKGGFYRCSKQASELYIEEFSNRFGLPHTILRYGTLYGPRADERNSVYRYVSQALKCGRIEVSGTGKELREYIHVRDAARLSVRILDEEFKNRHLIITGHHPVEFGQLLEIIKEILGQDVVISYRPLERSDVRDHYSITPYSFTPKVGEKLTTDCYVDLGQGLLECLGEIYNNRKESS